MTSPADPRGLRRHFLALQLSPAARDALSAVPVPEGARREDPRDLHVTLAFLGTLSPDRVEAALEVARAFPLNDLTVRLDTLQTWPVARVSCAVGSSRDDAVAHLAARLETRLIARGFERAPHRFVTHVTLARSVPPAVAATSVALEPPVTWVARSLALMASRDGARPRYTVIRPDIFSPDSH